MVEQEFWEVEIEGLGRQVEATELLRSEDHQFARLRIYHGNGLRPITIKVEFAHARFATMPSHQGKNIRVR